MPDRRKIELPPMWGNMSQQFHIVRWNREKLGGSVPFNRFEHRLRSWWIGQQNARPSDREWKVESVPQSVGKEELGDTEKPVNFRDLQNRLGVALRTYNHVVLQMHTRLRPSGTAG